MARTEPEAESACAETSAAGFRVFTRGYIRIMEKKIETII